MWISGTVIRNLAEQFENLVVNEYQLSTGRHPGDDVRLIRKPQKDGSDKWAILRPAVGLTMNKALEWEPEPSPSNRDDAFLYRCRWDTPALAFVAWCDAEELAETLAV